MALLGKISAVLTANTQDFTRQIGTAKRELTDFARTVNGIRLNLDNKALNGTLTQLQRFQRTIQEIKKLQAQGVGAGLPNPDRLLGQFKAFEDIGKPLTALKNQIEGLSSSIQQELYPELGRVQAGFRRLYKEIADGTVTFESQGSRIDALKNRLVALGRATAAMKDFGGLVGKLDANNAGASFFQPRAKEALQKSLSLRDQAEKIPAAYRGGQFADLAVAAEQNAGKIEAAAARVAKAQLLIASKGATPSRLVMRGRAQQQLDRATVDQEAINNLFSREISSSQIRQVVSPAATREVDALIEKFSELSGTLRSTGDTRFNGLISSVGSVVEKLNQGTAAAKEAKAAVDSLAAASRQRDNAKAGFDAADKIFRTDSERTVSQIRSDFQAQRNQIIGGRPTLGPRRQRSIERLNIGEASALEREQFNRVVGGSVGDLSKRVKDINDPALKKEFDNIRSLSTDANLTLQRSFDAKGPKAAGQALDEYRAKYDPLIKKIEAFEARIKSAETAQKRFQQFLEISGSRSDKLGADLDRGASDIAVARQFAGNFGANNIAGRRNVSAEIEKQIKVYQRLTEIQQRIFDKDFKNEGAKLKAIQSVTKAVENQREKLKQTVVDNSDGLVNGRQYDAAAARAAKNRGSFAIAGAASAQLAFQQGLFAIDDFMSATGGVEYKLRAIGNNITQLGLLLGQSGVIPGINATTGLLIGLATVLGGQLASAFARSIGGAVGFDDKLEALNDTLRTQQSAVKDLATAFSNLAKEIGGIGLSAQQADADQFIRKLDEIQKKQEEFRRLAVSAPNLEVAQQRGVAVALEKKLKDEANPAVRIGLERQIKAARRAERRAQDQAVRDAARITPEGAAGIVIGARTASNDAAALKAAQFANPDLPPPIAIADALRRADLKNKEFAKSVEDRLGAEKTVGGRFQAAGNLLLFERSRLEKEARGPARDESLRKVEEAIAQLDDAIIAITNTLELGALTSAKAASDRIGRAQDSIAESIEAGIPKAAEVETALGSLSRDLKAALDSLAEAQKSARENNLGANPDAVANAQKEIDAITRAISSRELEAQVIRNSLDARNAEVAAIESAAKKFGAAFDAILNESNSMVDSAKKRASDTRAEAFMLGGRSPIANRVATVAERGIERQRDLAAQVSASVAAARDAARMDPEVVAGERRVAEIDRMLKSEGVLRGNVDRQLLVNERSGILAANDARINGIAENDFSVRRARNVQLMDSVKAKSAEEGFAASLTDAQKSGLDLAKSLVNVRDAVDRNLVNQDDGAKAQRRLVDEAMRNTAPAIFNMADEVQNAIMQGPSRAALQASDVSTVQGASELNRLLRGDDSAKNQNLVELQKQSQSLDQLVQIAKENGAPPGVFDN
jgi:hypothetical protein